MFANDMTFGEAELEAKPCLAIDFNPLPKPDVGVRPPGTDVFCVTNRPGCIIEWSAFKAADHVPCPSLAQYTWDHGKAQPCTVMTVFARNMDEAFSHARTMLHSYMED